MFVTSMGRIYQQVTQISYIACIFVRASRRETLAVANPARFALSSIARVPIHLTRHVHHDRQDNEECVCAHQQGIILLPKRDIKKCIKAHETSPTHPRTTDV